MTRSTNWGLTNASIKPVNKTHSHKKLKRLKHDKTRQLYLDFGQKSFGPIKCKNCGMLYYKGEVDDEELHKKFHSRLIDGVQFAGWKNERVVGLFDEGRVVMVTPSDSKQHLKKVDEVLSIVHHDLGIEQDVKYGELSKMFMFISANKKVIGCVVADHINKAYRAVTDPTSGLTCCSSEPHSSVKVGIRKLWVSKSSRRKGIATKLLDCVRSNFAFGTVISRNLIAFSDLTIDGREFAKSYTNDQLLIYQ